MQDTPQPDSAAARIFAYLEDVVGRYAPIKHFQIGYPDEQAGAGDTPYPQVFFETDMQVGESTRGLCSFQVSLLVLDIPPARGRHPGTRMEKEILARTGGYVEELLEILRLEETLTDVSLTSTVSLTDYGQDRAAGWHAEISFTYPMAVNRASLRTRYTPPSL
ncbi:hypothetical protein [Hymenobacter tenuis]